MHQDNINASIRASFIWTLWKLDLADRSDKVMRNVPISESLEYYQAWFDL